MVDPQIPAGQEYAICRNCGRPAGPRFCGHCGQPLDDRRRPLARLARELLADWLSLDGRLLKSLAALARPGRLTLLHLDGKRAPYLRPWRLYLLASLALFSTVLTLRPPDATEIDLYVGEELVSAKQTGATRKSVQIVNTQTLAGRLLRDHYAEKLDSLRRLPPQELVDSMFRSLRRYLPAALILFVPFLAGALKLLYVRTGTLYLDHLVFSLHFQSALFFALAASWLIAKALRLGFLPLLLFPLAAGLLVLTGYLGMALHRVHPRPWWKTALQVVLLTFIYAQLMNWVLSAAAAAAIWEM